ncbi:MAG: endonuclease/exonuclease/phosphatase family protein [Saprospiraceae bacterium]|nr:endonuclease/exonuclease/phosphatase family protein [Saprospiraceae bacterium]
MNFSRVNTGDDLALATIMKWILFTLLTLLICRSGYCQSEEIRVMSYNILTGFDWGKDSSREASLVSWVKDQNADVIALQELCDFNQQKLELLAKKWNHNYAVILKEGGYPVGLTSNKPIELMERVLEGLWHGMLHCKTWGIDFYVVHLSPADWQFRKEETGIIAERIVRGSVSNDKYIVLGDFNAHSPFDGDFDIKYPYQLERARRGDLKNEKYKNLRNGLFDYSVMASFLSLPLTDVCQRFVSLDDRTTCPTPINVPEWLTREEMQKTKSRIDYILVSPTLEQFCTGAYIFNGEPTQYLSDHYPIVADFRL